MLQLLDAIRFIKKIPDTTVDKSCKRLLSLLQDLSANEQQQLIRLAYKYSPATRALLGALLSNFKIKEAQMLNDLYKSLNPITRYTIVVSETVLPTAKSWNIK